MQGRQTATKVVKQTRRCTYRITQRGGEALEAVAVRSIINAVEYTLTKRRLSGHLVVSIIDEPFIEQNGNFYLSTYQSSTDHITVAGKYPSESCASREEWLHELQLSLVSRVIEYEITSSGLEKSSDLELADESIYDNDASDMN